MSAICGVVHRVGRELFPEAVEPMMARLSVYGPDAHGRWRSGPAAFGHQHRCVTPESAHERQPLVRDGVVVVSDARLDNRDELLPALGLTRADAARAPDPDLLLRAYRRWGEGCVEHLVGDFALAIWDEERGLLFCARDHLGMRPLYYHVGSEVFAFATAERALLDLPGVSWEIDDLAVVDRLTLNVGSDPAATLFAAVRRLPPAHVLTVHHGELRTRRYWTPDLSREIRYGRDEEYVEAYREHLERALRDRLRTAHPVASFLSGGIDSPTVACLAARELARPARPPLLTYSNVLAPGDPWPSGDERPLIEAILAGQPHMEPRFVTAAGKSMARAVLEGGGPHGLPGGGTQFVTEVASDAQRRGARVLLGGYGGDQAATSRSELGLSELLASGRWPTFARAVRARAHGSGRSVVGVAGHALLHLLPPGGQRMARTLRHPFGSGADRTDRSAPTSFVADDLAARVHLQERLAGHAAVGERVFRRLRDYQWYKLSEREPQRAMEALHPLLASRGIEHALPLLDVRLVEYCLAVPCEQHLDTRTRSLVRRAMRGILPDEVRLREDKGYAAIPAPPRYVVADPDELRSILDRVEDVPRVRAFVDVPRLRTVLLEELPADIRQGGRSRANLNAVQQAFRTAYLLAWVSEEEPARAAPP